MMIFLHSFFSHANWKKAIRECFELCVLSIFLSFRLYSASIIFLSWPSSTTASVLLLIIIKRRPTNFKIFKLSHVTRIKYYEHGVKKFWKFICMWEPWSTNSFSFQFRTSSTINACGSFSVLEFSLCICFARQSIFIPAKLKWPLDRPATPSVHLANACSLDNRMDDISLWRLLLRGVKDCCIYVFTEMCLTDKIPDSGIELEGPTLLRTDRVTSTSVKYCRWETWLSRLQSMFPWVQMLKQAKREFYNTVGQWQTVHLIDGSFNKPNLKSVFTGRLFLQHEGKQT